MLWTPIESASSSKCLEVALPMDMVQVSSLSGGSRIASAEYIFVNTSN